MDLAALVGIVLAFGGIFGAQIMEGGSPTSIILVPPLVLVICGTLGAAMAGGVLKDTLGIVNQLKLAFTGKVTAPGELVDSIVKLGELIAGAFVATLWGVMLANVVFLPLGNRLKRLSELECGQMELAIEGVMAIQAGSNPRLVAQKLKSLLPPGEADKKAA